MFWLYFQLVLARVKRVRASLSPLFWLAGEVKRQSCAHIWESYIGQPGYWETGTCIYRDGLTGLPLLLPLTHQYRSSPRGFSEGAIGRRRIGDIFGMQPTCCNTSTTAVQLYSVISLASTVSPHVIIPRCTVSCVLSLQPYTPNRINHCQQASPPPPTQPRENCLL